jgi:hypothetical protein
MNWCDPCAADPLSHDELKGLGVFWLGDSRGGETQPMRRPIPQARDAFVTRLHVRYDAERFPDDLVFQETGDRTNFQGRYVLRHAWDGESTCDQADAYRKSLPDRWEKEAQSLASLTGWDINAIRSKMKFEAPGPAPDQKWWEQLWN